MFSYFEEWEILRQIVLLKMIDWLKTVNVADDTNCAEIHVLYIIICIELWKHKCVHRLSKYSDYNVCITTPLTIKY